MRAVLVTLLFFATALAGCTGDDPQPSTDAITEDPVEDSLDNVTVEPRIGRPTTYNLTGCQNLIAQVPMPVEAFGPAPEGFTYIPFQNVPDTMQVVALAYVCDSLDHRNGSVISIREFQAWLVVEPPTAWAHPDSDEAYLAFEVATDSPQALAFYHELGVDMVREGDVSWDLRLDNADGRVGSFTYQDGAFVLDADIAAAQDDGIVESLGFRIFFDALDGIQGEDIVALDVVGTPFSRFFGGSEIRFSPDAVTPPLAGLGAIDLPGDEGLTYSVSVAELPDL